jgi:large subunit ribosomal protein L19
MHSNLICTIENEQIVKHPLHGCITNISIGDALKITHVSNLNTKKKIISFGLCIAMRRKGLSSSILIRNHLSGEGVEQLFYIYAPTTVNIEQVSLSKKVRYRRAKLYYLRKKTPKESTVVI